jgi:hypothetical protein
MDAVIFDNGAVLGLRRNADPSSAACIQVSECTAAMAAETSNTLLLSHPSLRGVGHNCRLASCGRHGSELRDMVQPVRQHSIIGLGGWSRAILYAILPRCRELTAEGPLRAKSKNGLSKIGQIDCPLWVKCFSSKPSLLVARVESTVVVLATTYHAGRIYVQRHKRLGQRWTSPATYTRLECDST